MISEYYVLTNDPRCGSFAFEEDGVRYYKFSWGNHLAAARHGLAILGDKVLFKNFD